MLVFWKQNLVVLAVPKTGTTAYEEALEPHASMVLRDPPALKHAPLYRYNRFFRPVYEKICGREPEVLAVMREPISWLSSWYRYRKRPFLSGQPNSTENVSFTEFVEAYMQGQPPAYAHVGSQAKFLAAQPNGCAVNHLFRYEDQAGLRRFLSDRLGVTLNLPEINISPRSEIILASKVEARLRKKFSSDFALWESIAVRG